MAIELRLRGPLVAPVFAASAHGITDLQYQPRALWPYALMSLPIPGAWITPVFACSSVAHFAKDVGLRTSLVGHASLALLASHRLSLGFTLGCAYYLGVHVPVHVREVWRTDPEWSALAIATASVVMPIARPMRSLHLSHSAQKLVISHVLVDLCQNEKARRVLAFGGPGRQCRPFTPNRCERAARASRSASAAFPLSRVWMSGRDGTRS